jgi:hypothetical protein
VLDNTPNPASASITTIHAVSPQRIEIERPFRTAFFVGAGFTTAVLLITVVAVPFIAGFINGLG